MYSVSLPLRLLCLLAFLLCSAGPCFASMSGGGTAGAAIEQGLVQPAVSAQDTLYPAELAFEEQRLPEAALAPTVQVPEPVMFRAEPQTLSPLRPTEEETISVAHIAMQPALSMLPDRDAELSVEDAAGRREEFLPYDAASLLMQQGAFWLHYSLENTEDPAPHTLWMDLGSQLPPHVSVWLSSDGRAWEPVSPSMRGVYSLQSAGRTGEVLIRLDGMPGLWFSPSLIPLPSVLDSPRRQLHEIALAALGLMAFLSLFLSVSGRSELRFWCFVLASASAVQWLWAIPATASGIGVAALPGIFAAGIALVILPHIGRVLMQTREYSPGADVFFLLLALPGACAALLPLLPGMAWTSRLLVFWPFAACLCLLPALLLLLRGVRGSGFFTIACLIMGAAALTSFWGMGQGMEAELWAALVPAGILLGLIVLLTAPARREERRPYIEQEEPDLDPELSEETIRESEAAALRHGLKGSVEDLLDASCRLDQALSHAGLDESKMDVMVHADGMVAAARRISERLMDVSSLAALPAASDTVFELREVIQTAFSSAFKEAEKKGLGLSWYAAPHLGVRYRGDSSRLTALLSLLLNDAVRASSKGAVSLRVRRAPRSTHPGHLLFTVADTGEGRPPRRRSSGLLARVWEFASSCGGDVSIVSGPKGTALSFSMECAVCDDKDLERDTLTEETCVTGKGPLVIIASADELTRQMLSHYLEGLDLRVQEARNAAEAASLYSASPAALVVFDGSLQEEDMIQALAAVRMFEGEQSLAAVPFLLLARSELQAERMGKAGCDEALLPPLIRKDLRAMVKWLLAPTGTMARPVLSSQRVTLAAVLAGTHTVSFRLQRKGERRGMRVEKAEEERSEQKDAALLVDDGAFAEGEDNAPVQKDGHDGPSMEGADTVNIYDEPAQPQEQEEALQDEPEADMPMKRIYELLDVLSGAVERLESGTVRRGSAELAFIAQEYGMVTLADMARCFRAAWEEGDVDVAGQIVDEMRAEAARQ